MTVTPNPLDPLTEAEIRQVQQILRREREVARPAWRIASVEQHAWKVTNPNVRNKVGAPVAYKLVPGAAIPPMLDPASPVFRRAQVLGHTLWVTPFDVEERWPCGEFVNQSADDDGLPMWTAAGRSVENTDVVLWYVFGIHHVPRVEDWPVMPSDTVSFWLKPAGFFDANPSLDVAAS